MTYEEAAGGEQQLLQAREDLAASEANVKVLTEALNYIAACCPVNESTEHIITRATNALKEAGQ